MNNRAKSEYKHVTKSDWLTNGYEQDLVEAPVGPKLTNAIHPMFSYERGKIPHNAGTRARWGELTPEEYECLDQPLRLATQLLESAASADAICSIVYGDRFNSPENIIRGGIPVSEFLPHTLRPSTVGRSAPSVLKKLGQSIGFTFTERGLTDGQKKLFESGTYAHAIPSTVHFPHGIAITNRPQHKGIAVVVHINPQYQETLNKLHRDILNKDFQVRKLNFEIALTICHGVIHAINYALASDYLNAFISWSEDFNLYTGQRFQEPPPPYNEPFREGQDVAELGSFWENQVFGGICNQSVPNYEDPIYLCEWPSWMCRDKEHRPERALPRRRALRWLIPTHFVQNIQSQDFWDQLNLNYPYDLLALRIRRHVAFQCYIPEGEEYDTTWDPNAIENRLPAFLRVPWSYQDPSPGATLANETPDEKVRRLRRESQQWRAGPGTGRLNHLDGTKRRRKRRKNRNMSCFPLPSSTPAFF